MAVVWGCIPCILLMICVGCGCWSLASTPLYSIDDGCWHGLYPLPSDTDLVHLQNTNLYSGCAIWRIQCLYGCRVRLYPLYRIDDLCWMWMLVFGIYPLYSIDDGCRCGLYFHVLYILDVCWELWLADGHLLGLQMKKEKNKKTFFNKNNMHCLTESPVGLDRKNKKIFEKVIEMWFKLVLQIFWFRKNTTRLIISRVPLQHQEFKKYKFGH